MKTTVARTAAAIRKDLKAAYPSVKFSVRSQQFSGGDSIDVEYVQTVDGPRSAEVQKLLEKYQAGSFNGMEDIYEYKQGHGELTTKYLFVHTDLSQLKEEHKAACMKHWGLTSEDDTACYKQTGMMFWEAMNYYIRTVVLA